MLLCICFIFRYSYQLVHEFTLTYNKLNKGLCIFGVLSEERAPSSVIIPEPGVLPPTGERGPSSACSPDPECSPQSAPPCAGIETGWRWGVGVVEGRWKTRENEGKTAWLFIGILSRADWIGGVITDDELAVLIICACSSRNLLIKHHFTSSHLHIINWIKGYAYLACCPRRGLRAR